MIMSKTKIIVIILIAFIRFQSVSQTIADSSNILVKNKYLRFLLTSDSSTAKYFTLSGRYMHTVISPSFKSKGVYLNFGLNVGRLVSKKIFFGPTVDIKLIPGIFNQRFSSEFLSEFNSSFITNYNSKEDSTLAYKFKDHVNNGGFFYGNIFGNIGITFSLFPQKYGGIFITLKKGVKQFRTYGESAATIPNNAKEHYYLTVNDNYSAELSFKPFIADNSSFLIISVYYEKLNLKTAKYETLWLSQMVNNSFIKKYGSSNTFGLTIGYGF